MSNFPCSVCVAVVVFVCVPLCILYVYNCMCVSVGVSLFGVCVCLCGWVRVDCTRYDDDGCASKTWEVMSPNALKGGCDVINAVEFCTAPSERYLHGSAMFQDG